MYQKIIKLLKNKNVAILGFGVEGKSTYNFIRKYLVNQKLTIIDRNDLSNLELIKEDKNLTLVSGEDYLKNLDKYDLIIKSPGISFKDIDTTHLKNKITSQLELALMFYKNNIIGITGTKGKSTTSSLLYEVIKNQKEDVYLLGNIGNPILDEIETFKEDTILVIEMSSHQLEFINVSPHYGIILNLFEDHLDHAGSVKHYHECKMNMFKYQEKGDIAIYCNDNEALKEQIKNNNYQGVMYKFQADNRCVDTKTIYIDGDYIVFDGEKLYDIRSHRNLIGEHNLNNIMVVLLLASLLDLDLKKAISVINNFKGLPHRMEYVGTYDDVSYYSDTIATIPAATIAAIKSLKKVGTLIFGGMDRGINYGELVDYLNKCDIENIICMPTTGEKVGKQLLQNKNIYFVNTLEEAVILARDVTRKGTICLLSPAAPSYEYYKNFEEKGFAYQELIKKYGK